MSSRQPVLFALSVPLAVVLALGLGWAAAQPVPPAAPDLPAPEFDGGRAQADAEAWGAAYPVRVVGSSENAAFRAGLLATLTGLGLEVETQPFTVTVASQARAGVNVIARAPGTGSGPVLLLLAHYDTLPDSGLDNRAGVAALVELARVFTSADAGVPLVFAFTDSRAYGQAWGAKALSETWPAEQPIRAALSVETRQDQAGGLLQVDGAGFWFGYAPVWLRQLTREAAAAAGVTAVEPLGLDEALVRALPFTMRDASLLMGRGVPAVTLSVGPEALSAQALSALGQTAELWVRGLAARREAEPASAWAGWRLDDARVLPAWAARVASLLLLTPLFLATGLELWARRPRWSAVWPELLALAGALAPLLNAYAVAFVLVRVNVLPRYEWFPAAPGDRFLLQPTDWAMLVLLAFVGLSAWDIFYRERGWGRWADQRPNVERNVALLGAFSGLALLVWGLNDFAAVLFLLPAAWLWPWIAPRPVPAGRILNGLLAVGGLLGLLAVFIGVALTPGLGLWWWFLTAGAMYGLIPAPVVLVWAVFIALWVRFLRLGTRSLDAVSAHPVGLSPYDGHK